MADEELSKAVESHRRRNQKLRTNLIHRNIDLSIARPIDFHFWAWSQLDATVLGRELFNMGFLIRLLAPAPAEEHPDRWNIEAGAKVSIEEATSDSFVARLIGVARRCDAEFDGWGTSV